MTKKYFYDCPIKVAYMNHEFGVLTYIELSINDKVYDKCLIKDWNNRELELDEKNKYYVAPESEHIFEPKEGDIGFERNLHSIETCNFGGKYWAYENQELQTNPHQQRVETIYRNGKHFFNPLIEEN